MKTHITFKSVLILLLSLTFTATITAQSVESEIDEIVTAMYSPDETGIALLVAKDGKPIYKKAFGKANLELDVPMTTDNVFELASITKQFTAVAILMFEEQGKLKVEDELTKFVPDYPTKGKTITVHHLLNHTSGIRSYTSMENFMENTRTDMTVDELIDVFKNEPMDFDPGEKFLYNNSGYILLGKIIEVASGQTYEDFIEKHIFEKLGMTSSRFGSKTEPIKNRARGYQMDGLSRNLRQYISIDKDWEDFRRFFEDVHTDFCRKLQEKHPDLSANDLKICTLTRLNLNIKETASILGISPESAKTARYRLRKKLNLSAEEELLHYFIKLETA